MRAHSWPALRPSLRSTHCAAVPLKQQRKVTVNHETQQLPEGIFRIKKHEVESKRVERFLRGELVLDFWNIRDRLQAVNFVVNIGHIINKMCQTLNMILSIG